MHAMGMMRNKRRLESGITGIKAISKRRGPMLWVDASPQQTGTPEQRALARLPKLLLLIAQETFPKNHRGGCGRCGDGGYFAGT